MWVWVWWAVGLAARCSVRAGRRGPNATTRLPPPNHPTKPQAGNSTASKAAASSNAVFGTPPRSFAFLRDIFQKPPAPIKANKAAKAAKPQRVSFVNDLDVKATIYHQMNADMVVATGSSFPFVAVTVSPKVRVGVYTYLPMHQSPQSARRQPVHSSIHPPARPLPTDSLTNPAHTQTYTRRQQR